MKKYILMLMASAGALSTIAQTQPATNTSMVTPAHNHSDSVLPRWVFDINGLAGFMTQDLTSAANTTGYLNGMNINTGNSKFENGRSLGFDAQLGFFFGRKKHWGVGAGFMYLAQEGDLNHDNFHVEYQATDIAGNVYRQMVTGRHLEERLSITNMNIPVMLKYKARFSKHWGFAADAGALFNVRMKSRYSSDASFDYEAVYHYNNPPSGLPTTFDGANPPLPTSEIITKDYFFAHHPDGNVNDFFNDHRASGKNVGLGRRPNNTEGSVSYTTGSVGFMFQPSINYYISDNFALNLGGYYMYQSFKNAALPNYRLSSTTGDYSSSLNNVTASVVQSYGVNLGVRILFGKMKDTDMDGIPDKRDNCPTVWGLPQFNGCPDTDKDGIQDSEDKCPTVAGLAKFNGCPDTDGDGIMDKEDECPFNAGPAKLRGCPDRDGDGIADKDDLCPDKAGLPQFRGCPDTDGDGVPDNEDQCPEIAGPVSNHGCPLPPPVIETVPLTTPIFFELNKTVVAVSSYPVLDVAIKKLKDESASVIIIHGHADATGQAGPNKKLSMKRAVAVRNQLIKLGADPKRVKVEAHGSNEPAASNDTPEGRAQNRRAVMHLSVQ